jgi:hypothetical protein
MTIINVAVSRTRAIVASDTLTWDQRRPSHALKVFASPSFVLGAWGEGGLTQDLLRTLAGATIDEAIQDAPALVEQLRPVSCDRHAAYFVGWSRRLGRILARGFATRDHGKTWETRLLEPGDTWCHVVAPGRADNIPARLRAPTDLPSMFELMQAQTAAYADDESPVGGHALVYEVTQQRGIEFHDLGDLGVPELREPQAA